ncbi:MAG: hypothetical protein KatS3mg031_2515 [Chitinophagales bacterium]|nr:MAG: hypothetical protein KatS3mg031_2515 [Chitinophagales bacterium]
MLLSQSHVYIQGTFSSLNRMYTIILTLLLLTTSCKYFENKEIKGRPVAKVGNHILYYDEIDPVAKSLGGKADSAEIMRQYVKDWVKRKLMIQKAQRVLASR